jgi:Uma2 family endonuclease
MGNWRAELEYFGGVVFTDLQMKMQEYFDNGARLGWLIDPKHRRVYVYRQGQAMDELENPLELLGEDVVPGFVLDLRQIWS